MQWEWLFTYVLLLSVSTWNSSERVTQILTSCVFAPSCFHPRTKQKSISRSARWQRCLDAPNTKAVEASIMGYACYLKWSLQTGTPAFRSDCVKALQRRHRGFRAGKWRRTRVLRLYLGHLQFSLVVSHLGKCPICGRRAHDATFMMLLHNLFQSSMKVLLFEKLCVTMCLACVSRHHVICRFLVINLCWNW